MRPESATINQKFNGPMTVGTDEQTFSLVYKSNRTRVLAVVYEFYDCPARVDDITQEIFLTIWQRWKHIRQMERISAYILRAARNTCLNYLKSDRRQARYYNNFVHLLPDRVCETDQRVLVKELDYIVEKAIGKMSPGKRKVYEMLIIEGTHYVEVAKQLHITRSTILSQRAKAINTVKTYMSEVMNIGLNRA